MSLFARWGWLIAAMDAVFVLVNLLCIVVWDGDWPNWAALVICTALGVIAFRQWREAVEDERRWTQ